MRLFIAINFTNEIKSQIFKEILRIKSISTQGNFTQKDNIHLTLAFLGELKEEEVKILENILDSLDFRRFYIEFSNIGAFYNQRDFLPWIGIVPNDELMLIQQKLIQDIKVAGFRPDEKRFKPHITLARKVVLNNDVVWNKACNLSGKRVEVQNISLMKSEQICGRLTYTEIYKKDL